MPTTSIKPPQPADPSCALCGRPSHLTFHHLVPKSLHGKRWVRERHSLDVLRNRGIWICRDCHDFLHERFDDRTLAERLDSLEALRLDPDIAKHVAWASRQKRRV